MVVALVAPPISLRDAVNVSTQGSTVQDNILISNSNVKLDLLQED